MRARSRAALAVAVLALLGALGLALAPPASAAEITSPGPLTRIETTTDLNCAVNRVDDSAGEWFGNTGCGTLVAVGGTLFGPANIPAGGAAGPRTAFTPVSQTGPTGTGTAANPFRVVTVVSLGASGLRLTQTDTYVSGEESYRTDVAVSNTGSSSATAILYRAGDCYLQNSDTGFGSIDTSSGAVACVAQSGGVPGTRIEQLFPISAGSSFFEASFNEVWARIGARLSFPNTCRCSELIDNGAGLSWNLTVAGGASVTRSHLVTFSPLGRAPLSTDKTADSATSTAGATNGYTITVSNPNPGTVSLSAITDTLPVGFSYVAGSTSGVTTANPSVSGRTLTWSGSFPVPGGGSASLSFDVVVASTLGDYFNAATATASGFTVAPTGPTAPITVTAGGGRPPNDDFADAAPLTGLSGQATGTNVGATRQAGEPTHHATGATSVWYRWTPSAGGLAVVDTIGSGFDTLLGVYTGTSVGGLSAVASDGDSGGNLTSRTRFRATAGTTYRIAVDGVGGATGSVVLHFALDRLPVARAGADRTVPPGRAVTLDGSASTDPDGGRLDFEWAQVGGPRAVLTDERTARAGVRGLSQTGTYTFVLTVTDASGQQGSDQVVITVRDGAK